MSLSRLICQSVSADGTTIQIKLVTAWQGRPRQIPSHREKAIFLETKEGYFHDCCGLLLGIIVLI